MNLGFTSSSISTPGEGVVAARGGKVRLSLSFVTRATMSSASSPTREVVTGAGVGVDEASGVVAVDEASNSDL